MIHESSLYVKTKCLSLRIVSICINLPSSRDLDRCNYNLPEIMRWKQVQQVITPQPGCFCHWYDCSVCTIDFRDRTIFPYGRECWDGEKGPGTKIEKYCPVLVLGMACDSLVPAFFEIELQSCLGRLSFTRTWMTSICQACKAKYKSKDDHPFFHPREDMKKKGCPIRPDRLQTGLVMSHRWLAISRLRSVYFRSNRSLR